MLKEIYSPLSAMNLFPSIHSFKAKLNAGPFILKFPVGVLSIVLFMMLNVSQVFARNNSSAASVSGGSDTTRTLFGGTITNSGYGGVVLKFSCFNDQFAFMTGGRGAITINKKYTIGGGGYGIANSIGLPGSDQDTSRYFKMGYGGIESGYIFLPGEKLRIGGSLLLAAGAAFWQNDPKSNSEKLLDDDFKIFPVLEPSLYGEVALNRFMWLHGGISYRYIHNAHLDYMTDQNMSGFSCYIGLLFGK
jgi:hypothetical protein